jgi:hypothetical protein
MHTASEFKIYKQLSDEEMTSRGYVINIKKRQSQDVHWTKAVKFDEENPEFYLIEIKESISEEGYYSITPSISFEHMEVEINSLIDIDLDFIENVADRQSKLFLELFWS